MWRWLLKVSAILYALGALALAAPAPKASEAPAKPPISASSVGASTPAEARVLWHDGKAAAQAGRCNIAVDDLQRFVDRYPGQEGHLEAHYWLGRCRLARGETEAARHALEFFLQGSKTDAPGIASGKIASDAYPSARVLIARTWLESHHPDEAVLAASEAAAARKGTPAEAEAWVVKARALIQHGRLKAARRALDSAKEALGPGGNPAVQAEAAFAEVNLNALNCARLPSPGPMTEAQAKNQIERRGQCALEGLIPFRRALETGDREWADRTAEKVSGTFRDYEKACGDPPPPPKLKPKDRTKTQLKKYHAELATALVNGCRADLQQAIDTLKSWQTELPPGVTEPAQEVATRLRGLAAQPR